MTEIKNNVIAAAVVCIMAFSAVLLMHEPCQSAETPSDKSTVQSASQQHTNSVQPSDKESHSVIVYYFHGNVRCHSCNKIEQLTKQAVAQGFVEELQKGLLEIKIINVQQGENEHYVKEYKLYSKSVIVSDVIDGAEKRWKNLRKVWELLNNEGSFMAYIQEEVELYLQGN